jgi:hypothetical protein
MTSARGANQFPTANVDFVQEVMARKAGEFLFIDLIG